MDTFAEQATVRSGRGLNQEILRNITDWFNYNNHYVRELKTAKDIIEEGNIEERKIVIREDRRPQGEHERRYNIQTAAEVAILMDNEPTENRDIIIRLKDGHLKRISELHPGYDPLQYPLLFPHGTDGDHIYMQGKNGRKVTKQQYYSFHMMVRDGNYLLQGARLFQQYLVDAYCKIETERLQFLRREQQTLRADNYMSLRDSLLSGDGDPRQVGQRVVLPATYTGGPKYMHEKQRHAMAYVRRMGRADLFITMTCNPNWPEIVGNLLLGQKSLDRPDLVARVFRQKLRKMITLLKKGAFGKVQAWLYSIE